MGKSVQELSKEIKGCDMSRPFVFVSYSKLDAESIYPVIIQLQTAGYNIWIDKELRAYVGVDWRKKVLEVMAEPNCQEVLFIMSENSLVSAPVLAELFYSKSSRVQNNNMGKELRIIPVLHRNIKSENEYPNFMAWIDDVMKKGYESKLFSIEKEVFVGALDERYLDDGVEEIRNRGEIVALIKKNILVPLGGSSTTCAELNDIETIEKNIENTKCKEFSGEQELIIVSEKKTTSPSREMWKKLCKKHWDEILLLLFEDRICKEFDLLKVNRPIAMPKDCCALRLHSSKIRVEWFVNKKSVRTALIIKRESDMFDILVGLKDALQKRLEQFEGDIIWNLEVSNASVSISKSICDIEKVDKNEIALWYGQTASVLYETALRIMR